MTMLVNLGSLCIDHVYRVTTLAGAGDTRASSSHQVFPGGKGLNQSLAAARAGVRVRHFGCVGEDGGMLLDVLESAGVDVGGVRTLPGAPSGHAMIQVTDTGENAIVIAGGANRALTCDDFQAALGALAPGDWLLLQNEISDLSEVLRLAAAAPGRVALNLAPVDGREAAYDLGAVDLLIVNEIESRALVPEEIAAQNDAAVAGWLGRRYPGMDVVLTAGAEGLLHACDGEMRHLPAFAVDAVDETAAGDAFIGYLLAGLLQGSALADALRSASAAGALAVTVPGAASSIPDLGAVERLLAGQDPG